MKVKLNFLNLGLKDYVEVLELQRQLVELRIDDKIDDTIIIVEHPHVFTLGRKRSSSDHILEKCDIPTVEIERGGDITYHGPGQLIFYPIIKLPEDEHDLDLYLRKLELITIHILEKWGITAATHKGKTGVWVGEKKIASIGIAVKKWVTFHGVALNVNTDLSYFLKIMPCGFDGSVMTSLKSIIYREMAYEQIIYWMIKEFEIQFNGKAKFVKLEEILP